MQSGIFHIFQVFKSGLPFARAGEGSVKLLVAHFSSAMVGQELAGKEKETGHESTGRSESADRRGHSGRPCTPNLLMLTLCVHLMNYCMA